MNVWHNSTMMNSKKYLNLACGDYFIVSSDWVNADWAPKTRYVKQVDLLRRLPYSDFTFDLVYCSHFLEHIPRDQVRKFLEECYRVLKVGSIIRLALPDFENIAREYIKNIDAGNFLLSEFNIVEMIDQCVRTESGGELIKWYRNSKDSYLNSYMQSRTGYISGNAIYPSITNIHRIKKLTSKKILIKIQLAVIKSVTFLLPSWYKQYHIINTATGETHKWVYDFYSLAKIMGEVGFRSVVKSDAFSSIIPGFSETLLDVDEKSRSRKGFQSMYIEAVK